MASYHFIRSKAAIRHPIRLSGAHSPTTGCKAVKRIDCQKSGRDNSRHCATAVLPALGNRREY